MFDKNIFLLITANLIFFSPLIAENTNHPPIRYPAVPDGDKMIVIAAAKYEQAIGPFVEWKNRKGIQTILYEYPSETGGDSASALKAFIQQRYDEDTMTYILLVGDAEDVPSLYASGGPSDPSFALLANNDLYHDALIGRFSVETEEHAQIMVNKVLQYEMNPDPDGDWYNKACCITSSDGSPPDSVWMDSIYNILTTNGYSEVDFLCDPGASAVEVTNAINNGRGLVLYRGHSSKQYWGTTGFSPNHVQQLTNSNMLPVIISYSPNVSEFDGGSNCLAEEWVRAGSETEGTGAIAFYGSAASDCWCPWPMEGMIESVELLISNNSYNSLGGILYNGIMKALENGCSHKCISMHLFGDPSLLVYTQKPTPLTVTHPATIKTGVQNITVSSEDSARVCLYSKEQNIHEYTCIINNSAQFKIDVTTRDTILVTGTKQNRIPYLGYIIVESTDNNLTKGNNKKDLVQLNVTNNNIHFLYNSKLPSDIQLSIFSIAGKSVYSKQFKQVKKGFSWNLKDNRGYKISTGVYVAVLRFGNNNSNVLTAYFNVIY